MEAKNCSNTNECLCTNMACERHGLCCACVAFHRGRGYVPSCLRDLKPVESSED